MAVDFSQYRQVLGSATVRWLLIVALLGRIPFSAAAVILTLHVVRVLNLGFLPAGVLSATATVGIALGAPWRGRVMDRKGLRRALLPSIFAEAILWSLSGYLPYALLLPVAFIGGVFTLPLFTVCRHALAALVPPEQRRTAYAIDSVNGEMSFMVGPALGVMLATIDSRFALIVVGALSACAGIALYALNPPTRRIQGVSPEDGLAPAADEGEKGKVGGDHVAGGASAPLAASGRSRLSWVSARAVMVLVAAFAAGLVLMGTDLGIVSFLERTGHQDDIGLVFVAWAGASAVGGVVYGAISRSVSPLWLLVGLALVTALIPVASTSFQLLLLVIPSGLLTAPTLSAAAEWIADVVPELHRGEAMGWYGSAITLGSAISAPLTGATIDAFSVGAGFLTVAAASFVLALLGLVIFGRSRPLVASRSH